MIPIDKATAAAYLKRDRIRFLYELNAAERNSPPVPTSYWADADQPRVIMQIQEFPWDTFAMISRLDETFIGEAMDHMLAAHDKFVLDSPEEDVIEAARRIRPDLHFSEARCTRSYACTSLEQVPVASDAVTKLMPEDWDSVQRYVQKIDPGEGHGLTSPEWDALYGAWADGKIVGHLMAFPDYEEIWMVDLVFVREDHRGRGLAAQLAAFYARDMLGQGLIPHYGTAANSASERTAEKAGFHCCRAERYVDVSREP